MEELGPRLQQISVQFLPFMMAVVFHEYAHGFVANLWGDKTAKDAGRLTLNPVPHIDPIGTLAFPLINMALGMSLLFGWAKPVPIDPTRFRKYRPGLFWVSIAGVSMNFLLATISAAIFCGIRKWVQPDFYYYEPLITMAYVSVSLNFALGIFNLIPLPPLDGSKVVESFLPLEAARKYESLSQYSFFILWGLLLTGAFQVLAYPIQMATGLAIGVMSILFNVSFAG
jgi:Zn-dependent protease